MFRIASIAAGVLLVVLTACESGEKAPSAVTGSPPSQNGSTFVPVTPVPKPTSVPEAASAIGQSTTLGRIVRRANEAPLGITTRTLSTAACQAGVMVLETSEEMIHAAMPCDRFWNPATVEVFSGEEVAIAFEVTGVRFQIFIETLPGAQAEFTVEGIWVE